MFQKTYNFVLGNAFLRSSAIVFGSNLLVGVLNYALVIFAARALGVEYSVWTALTGLFAILTTFNTGLYTEVNKKFAAYAKQAPEKALEFYDFLMVRARQLLILGIALSPLLGVILWGVTRITDYPIYILIVWSIFLGIFAGMNRFLLIGMLYNFKFGMVTLANGVARFGVTLALFEMGFRIWALPLGLIASQLMTYALAVWYIHHVKKHVAHKNAGREKTLYRFRLRPHLLASVKSTAILFCLASFLNLAPILSERLLSVTDKDLFAVLFNFGQIIHFGSTAFTQAIVVHASRSTGNKIYYFSIGLMTLLTSLIGSLFYFFGDFMLGLFGKSQYVDSLDLILYYSLFIVFYNVVFISVQYLLSHSKYGLLATLPVFCAILVGASYVATRSTDPLSSFITAQIVTGAGVSLLYAGYIVWSGRSAEKSELSD